MKKKLIILILFFTQFSACMITEGINIDIRRYTDTDNEFISRNLFFDQKKIYLGYFIGEKTIGETRYSEYYFRGVLNGSNDRTLQILIPEDPNILAQINDINTTEYGNTTAYLFSYFFNEVYYSYGKVDNKFVISTENYFAENYPDVSPEFLIPHAITIIIPDQFEDVYLKPFVYVLKYDSNLKSYYWSPIEAIANIKWIERNPQKISMMKLKYLYSYPLDIITFPIQAVLYLFGG